MEREEIALEIFHLLVGGEMETLGEQKEFCYEVADFILKLSEMQGIEYEPNRTESGAAA